MVLSTRTPQLARHLRPGTRCESFHPTCNKNGHGVQEVVGLYCVGCFVVSFCGACILSEQSVTVETDGKTGPLKSCVGT